MNEGGHLQSGDAGAEFEYPVHDRPRVTSCFRCPFRSRARPPALQVRAPTSAAAVMKAPVSADIGPNDEHSQQTSLSYIRTAH